MWIDTTTKQSQPVDNNKKLLMIIWTHERSPNQIVSEKTVHLSLPSFCILPWWISHLRLAARSDIYSLCSALSIASNEKSHQQVRLFCMETIFGSYNWFGSRQKKQADDSRDHVTYPQGVNRHIEGGGGKFSKNFGIESTDWLMLGGNNWRVRIVVSDWKKSALVALRH